MQTIAGLKVPCHLEFGDDAHIRLRKRIEHRLELQDKGMKCMWCEGQIICVGVNYKKNELKWQCACGESFTTDCDGDDEAFSDG